MAYREFVDSAKVLWRAWATYPTVGKVLSKGFENGWLTFESQTECRRLAPIPAGWEDFPDAKLLLLLKAATEAKKKPASPQSPPPMEPPHQTGAASGTAGSVIAM